MTDLAVSLTVEQLETLVRRATKAAVEAVGAAPPREVLTLAECAELLQRHPRVVMQLVREAGLPAHFISVREPRFKRIEVLNWLDTLPEKAG